MNDKLSKVDSFLANRITTILQAMKYLGFEMIVFEGFRTAEKQHELYSQGRTKPGSIVTNCDGTIRKSMHQSGRAVDCVFLDEQGKPSWALKCPWKLYGEMGKALGLKWLGDTTLGDMPHLELYDDNTRTTT